jgi:hypothetical protein
MVQMSESIPLPPGFDQLSIERKLEYVQLLWNHITKDEAKVPVPNWHKEIIQERIKNSKEQPEDIYEWENLRAELQRELRERNYALSEKQ